MRARSRLLPAFGAAAAALILTTTAVALADHGGGNQIDGVVVKLALTAPSSTPGGTTTSNGTKSGSTAKQAPAKHRDGGGAAQAGTPVGTLTVLSGAQGQITVTVLSTTRFTVTGAALATGLVGSLVKVQTAQATGGVDATQVKVMTGNHASWYEIRGVVTAIGNGTVTIQTNAATVTGTLDPQVVVTVGDGKPGSLTDVTVNAKVKATWQVVNGELDVTAIRVLGGAKGDSSSNGGGQSGNAGGGNNSGNAGGGNNSGGSGG